VRKAGHKGSPYLENTSAPREGKMREIKQEKGRTRICERDGETLEVRGIVGNSDGVTATIYMACPKCDGDYYENAEWEKLTG
jgi:hypothetical protein